MVQKDQGGIRCEGLDSAGGNCPDGKIPALLHENRETWRLFQEMLPGLVTQGGFDYSAIQIVFDAHGIKQERRSELMSTFVKMIGLIEKVRRERAKR